MPNEKPDLGEMARQLEEALRRPKATSASKPLLDTETVLNNTELSRYGYRTQRDNLRIRYLRSGRAERAICEKSERVQSGSRNCQPNASQG